MPFTKISCSRAVQGADEGREEEEDDDAVGPIGRCEANDSKVDVAGGGGVTVVLPPNPPIEGARVGPCEGFARFSNKKPRIFDTVFRAGNIDQVESL